MRPIRCYRLPPPRKRAAQQNLQVHRNYNETGWLRGVWEHSSPGALAAINLHPPRAITRQPCPPLAAFSNSSSCPLFLRGNSKFSDLPSISFPQSFHKQLFPGHSDAEVQAHFPDPCETPGELSTRAPSAGSLPDPRPELRPGPLFAPSLCSALLSRCAPGVLSLLFLPRELSERSHPTIFRLCSHERTACLC